MRDNDHNAGHFHNIIIFPRHLRDNTVYVVIARRPLGAVAIYFFIAFVVRAFKPAFVVQAFRPANPAQLKQRTT